MQVLSSVDDWPGMLNEVRRILPAGGIVVVGHIVGPESGIDRQLKRQLASILEEMQVAWHRQQDSRREALAWLESSAVRHTHVNAASWNVNTTAEEFLLRHRTGARFAALPIAAQEQALGKLRAWVEARFGSATAEFQEERCFELDIFEF